MAVTLAIPEALVTAVRLDSVAVAPLSGAVKVTVAPLNGVPDESFTVACSAIGKTAPNPADCGVPPVAVMLAGGAAVLLNEKDAENAPAVAVMVYVPDVALAVAVTLATPEALVTAVALDRVALAPVAGAAKVTVAPLIGFPAESLTVACSAFANEVPTAADCGVPPVAAIRTDVFVKENATISALTPAVIV